MTGERKPVYWRDTMLQRWVVVMGEAADDAIDRGMEEWLSGELDDEGYYVACEKTCRRCGASGLQWGQASGKWKLFGPGGEQHVCSVPAAKKAFK
jgi:hypothetical protein